MNALVGQEIFRYDRFASSRVPLTSRKAFSPTACYLFDCETFLTNYLRDLVASQYEHPQYIPAFICPDLGGDRKPCAVWQDALFLIPFVLHNNYDNLDILRTCYEPMKRYFENGIPKDKDGLWAKSFQFGGMCYDILTSNSAKTATQIG